MRLVPDALAVPEQLALFLRGISPGGLTRIEPRFHHPFGFAEHDRNILERMQTIADKKWHHHDITRLG